MKLLALTQNAVAPAAPAPKPSLADRLGLTFKALGEGEMLYKGDGLTLSAYGRPPVSDSADLQRVLKVPRRPRPSKVEQEAMAEEMTVRLGRDNPACRCAELNPQAVRDGLDPCIRKLNRFQGWYLWEAANIPEGSPVKGIVGSAGPGHGKTGIDILAPMVLLKGGEHAILLVPPSLRSQLQLNIQQWEQHFKIPNISGRSGVPVYPDRPVLEVLPYSQLSRPENTAYLIARKPRLVLADECQALKNPSTATTSRFLGYVAGAPHTLFCPHSGSLSGKSIKDWWHLLAVTLREHSPMPHDVNIVKEWAGCVDPYTEDRAHLRAPMGALRQLCRAGEDVRAGFLRNFVETFGVVSTDDLSVPTKLKLRARTVEAPEEVRTKIRQVKETGDRPDGETLIDILEVMTTCSQLGYGFFYRWRFPHVYDEAGDEVEDEDARRAVVDTWFSRRKAWNAELRNKLERRIPHLDSEALCRNAAIRFYEGYRGELPTWEADKWPAWVNFRDRVEAVPDTVWVSDYLVRDAAAWAREHSGIIWTTYGSFSRALAKMTGLPRYGADMGKVENLNPTPEMMRRRENVIRMKREEDPTYTWGDKPSEWIQTEDGSRPIIASVKAHGTGKNLHAWHRSLFANVPGDADIWEQALARQHRPGQAAPVVYADVYQHLGEMERALAKALGQARYKQQTEGAAQRLLCAEWDFEQP